MDTPQLRIDRAGGTQLTLHHDHRLDRQPAVRQRLIQRPALRQSCPTCRSPSLIRANVRCGLNGRTSARQIHCSTDFSMSRYNACNRSPSSPAPNSQAALPTALSAAEVGETSPVVRREPGWLMPATTCPPLHGATRSLLPASHQETSTSDAEAGCTQLIRVRRRPFAEPSSQILLDNRWNRAEFGDISMARKALIMCHLFLVNQRRNRSSAACDERCLMTLRSPRETGTPSSGLAQPPVEPYIYQPHGLRVRGPPPGNAGHTQSNRYAAAFTDASRHGCRHFGTDHP